MRAREQRPGKPLELAQESPRLQPWGARQIRYSRDIANLVVLHDSIVPQVISSTGGHGLYPFEKVTVHTDFENLIGGQAHVTKEYVLELAEKLEENRMSVKGTENPDAILNDYDAQKILMALSLSTLCHGGTQELLDTSLFRSLQGLDNSGLRNYAYNGLYTKGFKVNVQSVTKKDTMEKARRMIDIILGDNVDLYTQACLQSLIEVVPERTIKIFEECGGFTKGQKWARSLQKIINPNDCQDMQNMYKDRAGLGLNTHRGSRALLKNYLTAEEMAGLEEEIDLLQKTVEIHYRETFLVSRIAVLVIEARKNDSIEVIRDLAGMTRTMSRRKFCEMITDNNAFHSIKNLVEDYDEVYLPYHLQSEGLLQP